MDFLNQASWPTSSSRSDSAIMATTNANPPLASTATCGSDMTTKKMLFNSVISKPGARFITLNLKNFYLKTPLPHPKYMMTKSDILPDEIIEKYSLYNIIHNEYVYFKRKMGMYGLPESGILAKKLLKKRLRNHGYYECQSTPASTATCGSLSCSA